MLLLAMLTSFACGEGAASSPKGRNRAKKAQPNAEARTLSKKESAWVGIWKVTKYSVPGGEYGLKNKGYFLTLGKDGTVSCSFPMDEPENPQENGAKGTGTWKIQTPRPEFWEGKIMFSEKKDEKYALMPTDGEVLVIMLKTAQGVKELRYLVGVTAREMTIGLPSYYFSIALVR